VWDALALLFGEASTETARSGRGKIVRSLVAAHATAEQIAEAPRLYAKIMPEGTLLTEHALEKHWPLLWANGNGKKADPPCEECGIGGGQHLAECSVVHV
jgi:hypothetical protein